MKQNSKIKVSIITGFLGAGKSTFINRILKTNPTTQFALVENEFGAISIDSKLIKGVDASQMFELKQGCICCTISDEYELVLLELAERFPHVEHLLIETTGIADPTGVLLPFLNNSEIIKHFNLLKTVCLVDSINFKNQPNQQILIKQIAVADEIIITKSEKATDSEKLNFSETIKKINPAAKQYFASFGHVNNFNLTKVYPPKKQTLYFKQSKHAHIQTKLLTFSKPLNKTHFENWLNYTLDLYKKNIYRTKGFLCFENEMYEHILQGVGNGFVITEGDSLLKKNTSEIILIGTQIPDLHYIY